MRNSTKIIEKNMLSFDRLCDQSKKFSRLTGVKLEEFREIVRKVRPKWNAFQKKKKIAGRNSKIKSLEDEVLLVLIYYRFYVSFQFLGALFGLDESNACRHVKRIEKMLASFSKRVAIEHVFAQLKKFKILGSVYRNFRKKLHLRVNIIAGIYNLRFS